MVPECSHAFIGGSSTLSINMPEQLELDYIEILERGLYFDTPYGKSPEFKLLKLRGSQGDKKVITCNMHGWRSGVSRADSSRQIFWVFREAGVKRILAEGGVGAINHLLKPRDIVIPHDYIDYSLRKDVGLGDKYLLIMRDSLCPDMRARLIDTFYSSATGRVFDRSIYANTDGRHFESPAEISMFKLSGADVVGQSLCPEVYLAREIGACYAGVYLVVNYAEGIIEPWQHEKLTEIFYDESVAFGRKLFEFLRDLPVNTECQCRMLRKETLLKGIY